MIRTSKVRRILASVFLVAGMAWTTLLPVVAQGTGPTATPQPATGQITVYAAASLNDAFTEIGRNFEAVNPGTRINFSFAGAQQLAEQIGFGAPADVFASANTRLMNAVIKTTRVTSGTQQIFVRNRLVVVVPRDNPARIYTLRDLAKQGIKIVLANRAVPVGTYSLDFLNKASSRSWYGATYSATVLANVVSYEEDVRTVFGKVALGEADAGIVYTSDVIADKTNNVRTVTIPDSLNTIATYPIAPLADSSNPALAQRFVEYVLSRQGQQVLTRYGFIPVKTFRR
ncbi:MAG: molybdate ABC transporter substrate-binding protein [Chloroflexi bacterium]|nr:molybdate ABC transporter substrate-binding protein [Chloroflexota bacterium]